MAGIAHVITMIRTENAMLLATVEMILILSTRRIRSILKTVLTMRLIATDTARNATITIYNSYYAYKILNGTRP